MKQVPNPVPIDIVKGATAQNLVVRWNDSWNLSTPVIKDNCLSKWQTVSFSIRILLYRVIQLLCVYMTILLVDEITQRPLMGWAVKVRKMAGKKSVMANLNTQFRNLWLWRNESHENLRKDNRQPGHDLDLGVYKRSLF
jgi:hypothetical protein